MKKGTVHPRSPPWFHDFYILPKNNHSLKISNTAHNHNLIVLLGSDGWYVSWEKEATGIHHFCPFSANPPTVYEIWQQEVVCSFTHSPFTCLLCIHDHEDDLIDQLIQASSYYRKETCPERKGDLPKVSQLIGHKLRTRPEFSFLKASQNLTK